MLRFLQHLAFTLAVLAGGFALPSDSFAQVVTTFGDNPIAIDDGLTLDLDGNLYGSSFITGTNGLVRKVSPGGISEVLTAEIPDPLGHDFAADGNLYITSFYQGEVLQITPDGTVTVLTDEIVRPAGLVVGADGWVYVASYGLAGSPGDTIYRVSLAGVVEVFAVHANFHGPVGIDFDEAGNLYVGSYNRGFITRVDPEGGVELLATVPGPNGFNTGYIAYSNNAVYATGIGTHKIYKLSLDTLALDVFAGTGVPGHVDGEFETARFNQPNGLVVSASGDTVYVSEYGNKTVRLLVSGDTSSVPDEAAGESGGSHPETGSVHSSSLGLQLAQSSPNPAKSQTQIVFSLAEASSVTLRVFDVSGREIVRPVDGYLVSGSHQVAIDTSQWANGVYAYRLSAGREHVSRELVVLQ